MTGSDDPAAVVVVDVQAKETVVPWGLSAADAEQASKEVEHWVVTCWRTELFVRCRYPSRYFEGEARVNCTAGGKNGAGFTPNDGGEIYSGQKEASSFAGLRLVIVPR